MTVDALGLPPAEFAIDERLVRVLLEHQHPDLADRPLSFLAAGWDNATYRLGDDLAVRLPRIAAGDALIRNEQRWLPKLAERLPIPIPAPVRTGRPGAGYPWHWSVVPWFPGRSTDTGSPRRRRRRRSAGSWPPCTDRRRRTRRATPTVACHCPTPTR